MCLTYLTDFVSVATSTGQLGPAMMDTGLAFSLDGEQWFHPPDRPGFIPVGPPGSFYSQLVYGMPDPIVMGDEVFVYFSGASGDGNIHQDARNRSAIGLARMRLQSAPPLSR